MKANASGFKANPFSHGAHAFAPRADVSSSKATALDSKANPSAPKANTFDFKANAFGLKTNASDFKANAFSPRETPISLGENAISPRPKSSENQQNEGIIQKCEKLGLFTARQATRPALKLTRTGLGTKRQSVPPIPTLL